MKAPNEYYKEATLNIGVPLAGSAFMN
jgi:hypothetical protein